MRVSELNFGAFATTRTRAREIIKSQKALIVLAGAGGLSFVLYLLAFVRPFNLLELHTQPQLDLQRVARINPAAPWLLLLAFVAQTAIYYLAWRATRALRSRAAWAVVLGGGLLFSLALAFLWPFDANDIFDNIMHARMSAFYGANPFVDVIARFSHDPLARYAGWPNTPSAYGPLWELMAAPVARLAGDTVVGNVLAFKLLGGIFLGGSAGLVAAILRRVAPERALSGVLLLLWNPVVLYETMGHGHNDIVMMFWVLAAIWAITLRRHTLAVLTILAGALVKFIPVLMLPAAVVVAWRHLQGTRARLRFATVTVLGAVLLVILLYAPFWEGMQVLGIERRSRLFTTSLPAVIYVLTKPSWGETQAAMVISRTALALTALFALGAALWPHRGSPWQNFTRAALATVLFYLMVTVPWFQNWYAVWPLALAVVLPAGHLARLGYIFAFATLSKPLIFAPLFLWPVPFPPQQWRELRLGPAVMAIPWLYTIYALWDWLRGRIRPRHGAAAE